VRLFDFRDLLAWTFRDSRDFAFWSSAQREALKPLPPRLMKYVSMRNPDCGPLGDTFFEASDLAMVAAFFVNKPRGGCVESVLTLATHRFCFLPAIGLPSGK
jgi:hypothetical protein